MKENYKIGLKHITTFIFDVDGVFTDGKVFLFGEGKYVRSFNNKDSYAVHLAKQKGYHLAVITGGNQASVEEGLKALGIDDVFMRQSDKLSCLEKYTSNRDIKREQILYMGDDLPDAEVMTHVGMPVCPNDAATEIKELSRYVSPHSGGNGCVRDVIEQVLRVRGDWQMIPW